MKLVKNGVSFCLIWLGRSTRYLGISLSGIHSSSILEATISIYNLDREAVLTFQPTTFCNVIPSHYVLMIFEQPNIKHLLSKHNTFVYVSVTHRQQQHHFIQPNYTKFQSARVLPLHTSSLYSCRRVQPSTINTTQRL